MKRSESVAYLRYGRALADSQFELALSSLLDFVEENQTEFAVWDRSFTLQQLGEIYFQLGKKELAKFFYDVSLEIDSSSLEAKLSYAFFIARKYGDRELAIRVCDNMLAHVRTTTATDTGENIDVDYYVENAARLKDELSGKLADGSIT